MKYLSLPAIAVALFLLTSCGFKDKQATAEALVKKYLDSSLNDPKSYESIKFEKLDTVLSSVMDTKEYKDFERKEDSLKTVFRRLDDNIATATTAELNQITKDNDRLSKERMATLDAKTAFIEKYKGKFEAYKIKHEYRAKNGFGALIKTTTNFVLDSNLTKVENAYKIED